MKYTIGIDNGVSGSIAIIDNNNDILLFKHTPVFECLNYTKTYAKLHRISVTELKQMLTGVDAKDCQCYIERPMVNPVRFTATISAIRALEATLIVLEELKIPYEYIDSKEWQHAMLPKGIYKEKISKTGRKSMKADPKQLKMASKDVAKRLYPSIDLKEFNDADSLLIARYYKNKK